MWLAPLAVTVLGLILTLHQLGDRPLVDFDEAINAVITRQMARSGNWLVPIYNAAPHLRRPPLYFWMAAAAVVVTHQFSAFPYRLPAALSGVALAAGLSAFLPWRFGWSPWAGALTGVALLTMPYFLLLSREAMLAGPAAALVAGAVLSGSFWTRGRGGWWAPIATGAFFGLLALDYSAMVLLPLGVLGADALLRGRRPLLTWRRTAVAVAIALALGLWWPLLMSARYGGEFWSQFLLQNVVARVGTGTESGARPVYYYLPLLAAGLGAWGPLVAVAVVSSWRQIWRQPDSPERLAVIWLGLGLLGFSAVVTKLPWYSAPMYPSLALLAGAQARRLWAELVRARSDHRASSLAQLAVNLGAVTCGLGLAAWPSPRPVVALLVCLVMGGAALVVEIWAPSRGGHRVGPPSFAPSSRALHLWLAVVLVAVAVPLARAGLF
ncbi:MAG: hypothetical protein WBU92_09185, partial [Candidatus Dormiibacterota bacterium]